MNTVRIFQNFYDESQQDKLDPQLIPHFNAVADKYFCCSVLRKLLERRHHLNCNFFGSLSWKVATKTGRPGWWIKQFVEQAPDSFDFYYPHWVDGWDNIWLQGETCHPGIIERAEAVLAAAGYDRLDLRNLKTGLYFSNFGIVKSDLYEEYLRNMLRPCIDVMEESAREELSRKLNEEAPYVSSPPVSLERLKECTGGFPYYTFHSFIGERLFSTYAALKGWTCGDIPHRPVLR